MNSISHEATEFTLKTEEEKEKFQNLYSKYSSSMYSTAQRILNDRYLAEDVVHDSFLSVAHCLNKLHEENTADTRNYLLKIAQNTSYNLIKRRKKENPYEQVEEILPKETDTPELLVMEEEQKQELIQALKYQLERLKERDREILELTYFRTMQTKDIAKMLHISEAGVRKRVQRARDTLKKQLKKEDLYYF